MARILAAIAVAKTRNRAIIRRMLTYDPESENNGFILVSDANGRSCRIFEPIQSNFLGDVPTVLTGSSRPYSGLAVIAQYSDYWGAYPKSGSVPIIGTYVYDGLDESARFSVGQLGQLQDYRQKLNAEARVLQNDLHSLDALSQQWLIIGNVFTGTAVENPDSQDADQLNFWAHSPQVFPTHTECQPIIQEDFYSRVLRFLLQACASLRQALARLRRRVRPVSVLIGVFRAAALSALIFCSVRWEKRRWFLFHGARPPKSVQQAIWACLLEACSGSALA